TEKYQIENSGKINLSGKNATGMLLEGNVVGINSGTIEVSGDNSIGILVDTNATAINNGTITGKSNVIEGVFEEVETDDGEKEVYTTKKKYDWIEGMRAESGAVATNNKSITIDGSGAGMLANSANLENNGTIDVKSGNQEYISEVYDKDSESVHKESGTSKEDVVGMIGEDGSKITNGEKGKIVLVGKGQGMLAVNNSDAINKGTIEVTSEEVEENYHSPTHENKRNTWTEVVGMEIEENSTGVNNGTINLAGSAIGIKASENSIATNENYIYGESIVFLQKHSTIDSEGKLVESESIEETEIIGMEIEEDSTGVNNGTIELAGSGIGMEIRYNSTGENNGLIVMEGKNVIGAYIYFDGKFINSEKGIIEVKATERSAIGIYGNSSSFGEKIIIENHGTINVEGNGGGYFAPIGIQVLESVGKSSILNTGAINVIGDYSIGIKIDNGDLINNGKVTVKGKESKGIYITGSNSTATNNGEINLSNSGDGILAINGAKAINEGLISLSGLGNGMTTSFGEITNKKNIIVESQVHEDGLLDWTFVNGMYGDGSVSNDGKISVIGEGAGVSVINNTTASNSGKIYIETLSEPHSENSFDKSYGMLGNENSTIINEKLGEIYIADSGWGMRIGDGGTAENKGLISLERTKEYADKLQGGFLVGISAGTTDGTLKPKILNSGKIEISGDQFIVHETENSAYASGQIIGIDGFDIVNNGDIIIDSNLVVQKDNEIIDPDNSPFSTRGAIGINSSGIVENNKLIQVTGNYAIGILVTGSTAQATNNGIINIDGEGSYGMYADQGSTIVNGLEGTIKVGGSAAGGMYAEYGAIAINYGTINIHKDNVGGESIAMMGSGTLINSGTITADTDLSINTVNSGSFVIGTSENGTYGKISAKSVSLNGDIKVSANMTKNGFKDSYTMQNVVDAEEITYGDNFNFQSTSLLYDAEAITDRWGNLDGKLVRNESTLSDFTAGNLISVADIFGKYQNEEGFKTLSKDAQTVLKSIDTESVGTITNTLNELTPSIYANLSSQIFNIGEVFNSQGSSTISGIGENKINFSLLGKYSDVDSKNGIEGYESKLSGFIGAMDLGNGMFGNIGYGYSNIDYDDSADGKIETIHLGLNKLAQKREFDYKLGLSGEYNFHENSRKISTLGRTAESDFDSYRIGAVGEISKKYGEESYVEPFASLEIAYGKYDTISETGANAANTKIESQDYTSVLPKVGVTVGKNIDKISLYASVDYSYELGNMEKDQKLSFEGFEGSAYLPENQMENAKTTTKIGMEYKGEIFNFNINAGKEFGKRDNSFVGAGVGYKF
ncbi:hypothetical protein, partial [Cetobacterium sp.]|uniref:hypothetical protein n=1 Tax=Cetobacterium sp. TaxID=2071632 RepID=UPI003F39183F